MPLPFRSSSVASDMITNSSKQSPRNTQASTSNTTTDQGENVSECLEIEDLDLANLDFSPSTERSYSPTPDESSPEDEYNQGADYNSLFGDHIPSVVSEACLMNDLFILVKVPTNMRNYVSTSTASSQTSPRSTRASTSSSFVANRKIFPIPEEESVDFVDNKSKIPVATNTSTKKACWANDSDSIEEFETTTNIVPLPNQVPEPTEDPLLNVNQTDKLSIPCQKQIEMQEINLNSVSFEGTKNISLKNYGILITPTKASKTDNLLVFQVDTEPKEKEVKKSGQLSSCFGWLTRCFRRKRRKSGVVQAKVYKTYFVKWKKCSEDNDCSHCRCKKQKKSRRQSA